MDEQVQPILIRVNEALTLDAGSFSKAYDESARRVVYTVRPPRRSLLEQLLAYLDPLPNVPGIGLQSKYLGVGLTALAIRWGTYLATLLDEATACHSSLPTRRKQTQSQGISYLTNAEMRRLNIEISANLAHLGKRCRESRWAFYDLLGKAYEYLPMPFKTAKPNHRLEHGLIQAYLEGSFLLHLKRHPEQVAQLTRSFEEAIDPAQMPVQLVNPADADRVIANFLTKFAWRNTLIEDYHAGTRSDPGLLPHQRRFSYRDERLLLGELSSNMLVISRQMDTFFCPDVEISPAFTAPIAPFPESATALFNCSGGLYYVYPHDWSLTESSATVTL